MPTTWPEINSFYLMLGVIGIPLLLGFLTEAGKDLYNKITKKTTSEELAARCKESRTDCQREFQKELLNMHSLDKFMLERQSTMREVLIPEIKAKLLLIGDKQDATNRMLEDMQRKLDAKQ